MHDLTQDYPKQTEALREALSRAVGDKLDRYGIYSDDDCVHAVSAQSYDGFIAHTNGGFRTLVPCTLRDVESEGMTDFEETVLREYIDRSYNDAAEHWLENDAPDDIAEAWNDSVEPISAHDFAYRAIDEVETAWLNRYHNAETPELPGIAPAPAHGHGADELRESLYTVCDYWLTEGATYFYEVTVLFYEQGHRRNHTGADELYIFAGINTDFEYGRERGLQTVAERTFKLERLTGSRIDTIVDAIVDAI